MSKHQSISNSRLANAEFLREFLVEAVELRLSDSARIDSTLDGLIRQVIEQGAQNHNLDQLMNELHGDPRLRDRSRELSVRRSDVDSQDVVERLRSGLHSMSRQAKLAFLGEQLGLKPALEALANGLSISETDKTRILYENLHSHQVQPQVDLRGSFATA